jgi:hypothetical protein
MFNKSIFRIILFLSLSANAHANATCSETDRNDSIKRDSPAFVESWETCGRKSLGRITPFNKCLREKHPNISKACVDCFGSFVSCTRTNCLFSCMGFSEKWCEKCALDNCQMPLTECTGVSKENLPSKYPKTAL